MVIQSDVYTIILLTIIIGIAIVVLSKKIDALDPLEKPKGIYAAVFAGVEMVSNTPPDSETPGSGQAGMKSFSVL